MRRSCAIKFSCFVLMTMAVMVSGLAGDLQGMTFYVSNYGGDDSKSGETDTAPWKSIERVNRANLRAGDRVLFRAGDIFRGRLEILEDSKEGKLNQPIVFGRYGAETAADPILGPPDDTTELPGNVYITGSYIRIEHLDIRAFNSYAVKVQDEKIDIGNGENITIIDCEIRKAIPAQGSEIFGIEIEQSTGVAIKHSSIHGGLSYGVHLKDSDNCGLVGNSVYDCGKTLIRGKNVSNLRIEKNLCFSSNSGKRGEAIYLSLSGDGDGSYTGSPGAGIAILNNIITNCTKGMRFLNESTNREFANLQIVKNTLVASEVHFTFKSEFRGPDYFGTANVVNNISYLPENCPAANPKHFGGNAFKSAKIAYHNNNFWEKEPQDRANVADELNRDPQLTTLIDWCDPQPDTITAWFIQETFTSPELLAPILKVENIN